MTITQGQVGSARSIFERKAAADSSNGSAKPALRSPSSNGQFVNSRAVWEDHFNQAAQNKKENRDERAKAAAKKADEDARKPQAASAPKNEKENRDERAKAAAKKADEDARKPQAASAPRQAESSIDNSDITVQKSKAITEAMFTTQEIIKLADTLFGSLTKGARSKQAVTQQNIKDLQKICEYAQKLYDLSNPESGNSPFDSRMTKLYKDLYNSLNDIENFGPGAIFSVTNISHIADIQKTLHNMSLSSRELGVQRFIDKDKANESTVLESTKSQRSNVMDFWKQRDQKATEKAQPKAAVKQETTKSMAEKIAEVKEGVKSHLKANSSFSDEKIEEIVAKLTPQASSDNAKSKLELTGESCEATNLTTGTKLGEGAAVDHIGNTKILGDVPAEDLA